MRFKKLFIEVILYPAIVLIIFAMLLTVIETYTITDVYDSLIYSWKYSFVHNVGAALVFSILFGLLSGTIVLNKIKYVRSNKTLSMLSWFLLPALFFFLTLGKAINEYLDVGSKWEILYTLIAFTPFFVALYMGHKKFQFQKKNS